MTARTWSGTTNGNMATGTNWVGGVAPTSGDDIVITGANNLTMNNDLTADISLNNITFDASLSGSCVITGNRITLTGTVTESSGQIPELNVAMICAATRTIDSASGHIIILRGVISGSGGVTATGTGQVRLVGTNTFTGALTINSGATVRLGSSTSTGTVDNSSGITNNGILYFSNTTDKTCSLTISGSGSIQKNGTNTLTLSGPNTYTGYTNIDNGYISVSSLNSVSGGGASSNLGAPTTIVNGTIGIGANGVGGLIYAGTGETTDRVVKFTTNAGSIEQAGTNLLKFSSAMGASSATAITLKGSTAGTGEFAGIINDGGGTLALTKTGTGAWTLSAANTYTGTTTISGGTLALGNGSTTGSLSTSSTITVTSPGILAINRSNTTTSGTDFKDGISGTGAVTQAGAGTTVFTGAQTYSGATTVTGGTLQLGSGSTAGALSTSSDITVTSPGTLAFNRSDNIVGGTAFKSGISGTGNVAQNGSGILTFSGANTYSGTSSVTNGIFRLGNAGTTGSLATTGAMVATSPGVFTIHRTNTFTFGTDCPSSISGTGGLSITSTGTTVINYDNTYSGATTISGACSINLGTANPFGTGTITTSQSITWDNTSGSTLTLYANTWAIGGTTQTFVGTNDLIIPGNITLSTGSARTFSVTNASSRLTISGVISGGVGLTKSGAGILYLNQASNTYTGQTLLNAGTVEVDTLANISSACSLGAPTTTGNGTISFGSTTTGGTLVYRGGTVSIARYIKLNGSSGGCTLVNSGTGDLTFNSASAWATPTNGAKTLTIASTVAREIIFNAPITDTGAGAISVVLNCENTRGALCVSAACTYTGGTTITSGILRLGNAGTTGTISTSSAIAINTNGVFLISRTNACTQGSCFGSISGTGMLKASSTGGLTLNADNSAFSGEVWITSASVLTLVSNNKAAGTGTIRFNSNSVRLVITDGLTISNAVIIDSAAGEANRGLIENSGSGNGMLAGTVTINDAPANGGHFGGASTGKLTLAIVNSASVPVSQAVGTVQWAQAGSNFAALNIVGTAILADNNGIATNAVVTLDGGTINMTAQSQTLAGLIKGAGAAVIGGGGDIADSTLTITGDCNFAGVITNSFESGGKKTKVNINGGGKTVTLSGTNTYTGTTSVSAGTLIITGSTGAGAVSIASGATLGGTGTIGGAITPASGGIIAPGLSGVSVGQLSTATIGIPLGAIFSVDLTGTPPTFDSLQTTGTITLGGTLTIANYSTPSAGKAFPIISATTVTGTFNGLAEGATITVGTRTLQIAYTSTTVTLTDMATPGSSSVVYSFGLGLGLGLLHQTP